MQPGDLVRNISARDGHGFIVEMGLFMGLRTFDGAYECAEVMWFNKSAPNGDRVSTIQKNLIEVVK